MKASHRQILKWLRDGARIWSPSGACSGSTRLAWVSLPDAHPDAGRRVRVATMNEMTDAGLVVNLFGVENDGSEYADNIWALPTPAGRPLIEVLSDDDK